MTNPTQEEAKLSQWDALLLESLRALGWSNDELIRRVRSRELPEDDSIYHFNYQDLSSYADQEPEVFEAAVKHGYRIKYNTVRGIRSWISITFGKEPVLELEEGREAVTASLTQAERDQLASVLSFGWSIQGEASGSADEASSYVIEPIQR
ncbi:MULTISPECIES: hypothetical protein [Bacillales]|uniref:hypothetical protein n=1 Tax=Bacillales TaxID=1385 RepID=UPI0006A78FB7|nr:MULTISPECIES: hypothetical protein [Bacillales]OBZ09250.1 hypothetical protein A7975_24380 [Bacillus sp. FJAT-26390]